MNKEVGMFWLMILLAAVIYVAGAITIFYKIDEYEIGFGYSYGWPGYKINTPTKAISILLSWFVYCYWKRELDNLQSKIEPAEKYPADECIYNTTNSEIHEEIEDLIRQSAEKYSKGGAGD